jgi:hypothetical protein
MEKDLLKVWQSTAGSFPTMEDSQTNKISIGFQHCIEHSFRIAYKGERIEDGPMYVFWRDEMGGNEWGLASLGG